jgi:hypothetical protein
MEIKDLVSFYVNESTHTLDVTFRLDSDRDDEVRTDQIGFDEIKGFGYNFLDDKIDVYKTLFEDESFEDEEEFDSDIFEDIFSDSEIDIFLNYFLNNINIENTGAVAAAPEPRARLRFQPPAAARAPVRGPARPTPRSGVPAAEPTRVAGRDDDARPAAAPAGTSQSSPSVPWPNAGAPGCAVCLRKTTSAH